jgi:hypothetical protein
MSHKNLNAATAGKPKRVAIVISTPGVSTTTGWPVGFWWASRCSAPRAAPARPTR